MIRRFLILFALLMLTFGSAAFAHEHDMRHAAPQSAETSRPIPNAVPVTRSAMDHMAVSWLSAADSSICSAESPTACRSHDKLADCTCPAACVGLFDVASPAQPPSAEVSTLPAWATQHLSAMSSAPPTPPPRA